MVIECVRHSLQPDPYSEGETLRTNVDLLDMFEAVRLFSDRHFPGNLSVVVRVETISGRIAEIPVPDRVPERQPSSSSSPPSDSDPDTGQTPG